MSSSARLAVLGWPVRSGNYGWLLSVDPLVSVGCGWLLSVDPLVSVGCGWLFSVDPLVSCDGSLESVAAWGLHTIHTVSCD
jgi:hypothetical protein